MDNAQEQDVLAGEVMESLGEPQEAGEDAVAESHGSDGTQNTGDPLFVQKRLKQQKRAHEREIRDLHARIADMQHGNSNRQNESAQVYGDQPQAGGVDEQIHKAVSYALRHREMEESKAKQAEQAAHVNRQYQELHKHLDNVSDKYDDFDDVVRGEDAPFTTQMRDASLFLPKTGPGSAGEVLYKLGKDPEKLARISKLHPLDQATEMVKLSHALISGGDNKSSQQPKTLGQVKSSPVTNASHSVTEKTPIGNIRERMRQGSWK